MSRGKVVRKRRRRFALPAQSKSAGLLSLRAGLALPVLTEAFGGYSQSTVEVGGGREAGSPQFFNGRRGMFHIARTFRRVFDFGTRPGEMTDLRRQFVDGDTPAAGDVEHPGSR